MQKSSYKNLTCFNKAADRSFDERGLHLVGLLLATDFSSKKSKPEKALTSRRHRYCAAVELTILRETTSNRTASIFFTWEASPQEPVNKKSECFIGQTIFYNFFEWGVQWTRKIKMVTPVKWNSHFYQTAYRFLIVRQPFYGMEFRTLFCLLLYWYIWIVSRSDN